MGQLSDLLHTRRGLVVENSNRSKTGPSPPTRVYDATRYERSPVPQDNFNNHGMFRSRYDLQNNHENNRYRTTRRDRRLDRRNDGLVGHGRLLGGLRGRAGQQRPSLIGGMRDLLTAHMTQDQNRARPASFSYSTNAMQPALPATRMSPQYYPQGQHYQSQIASMGQQDRRSLSEEDENGYYSSGDHGSTKPYWAEELELGHQYVNDLPPRYEAQSAGEEQSSRYKPILLSNVAVR